MKKCFVCNQDKELDNFYKHPKMLDGHINKCKECTKEQSRKRQQEKFQNSEWRESEKERSREKYYRLEYKDKYKPTYDKKKEITKRYKDKYPEKEAAKQSAFSIVINKGNERHHWSYNENDWKDIIELSVKDHSLIHRNMTYDQNEKMYINLEGVLLNSKQLHLDLLSSLQ